MVATNLTGVAAMVDAVLPDLRDSAGGQVVVVSSYAAWRFSPHSGVAYAASKTALPRCARPSTSRRRRTASGPATSARATWTATSSTCGRTSPTRTPGPRMLTPDDVARAVLFVLESPPHVRIDELVISPVPQR